MDVNSIVSDPTIMMGEPVVTGTRHMVELILEGLAADTSNEQLVTAHPRLSRHAISAALRSAASAARADVVYPLTRQSA